MERILEIILVPILGVIAALAYGVATVLKLIRVLAEVIVKGINQREN